MASLLQKEKPKSVSRSFLQDKGISTYTSQPLTLKKRMSPPASSSVMNAQKSASATAAKTRKNNKSSTLSSSKTIGKFMKATATKRQSHFLKNICSDSGVCIAFGVENNKIKTFFNGFIHFDYIVPPISSIGEISANGFIKEINYEHLGYKASSILKSSQNARADNLYYEYIVGLQINEWIRFFPCFVETYGLYGYSTPESYKMVKRMPIIADVNMFKKSLMLLDPEPGKDVFDEYNIVCQGSLYLAVLIQHLRDAPSFSDLNGRGSINVIEKYCILAQVYLVLGQLTNVFVHNDLHPGNVLLYSPSPGKYIEFNYYMPDGKVVRFKSYYVAKMIDYGRCFITKARSLYDRLCATPECNPGCGGHYGFNFFENTLNANNFFISSMVRNPSHDLRLLKYIMPELAVYGRGAHSGHELFGTMPKVVSGLSVGKNGNMKGMVQNISDASIWFQNLMKEPNILKIFQTYPADKKFGELHIYMDMKKPMRFVPV